MKGTIGMKRDVRIGIKEPSPPKVPHRTRIKALQQVFAERWPLAFAACACGRVSRGLTKHLTETGIEADKMFRLVIDDVFDATWNKQEPFMYGSLPGRQDFYFRPQS